MLHSTSSFPLHDPNTWQKTIRAVEDTHKKKPFQTKKCHFFIRNSWQDTLKILWVNSSDLTCDMWFNRKSRVPSTIPWRLSAKTKLSATDWPRLANCVTPVVCLKSGSCIHHRAQNLEFPDSTCTLTKSFPLEVQPLQLQGQVCMDLHVEATLFFLELAYKLSQIHSIPPSCSHWCFNFRNAATDSEACFEKSSSSESCCSV